MPRASLVMNKKKRHGFGSMSSKKKQEEFGEQSILISLTITRNV